MARKVLQLTYNGSAQTVYKTGTFPNQNLTTKAMRIFVFKQQAAGTFASSVKVNSTDWSEVLDMRHETAANMRLKVIFDGSAKIVDHPWPATGAWSAFVVKSDGTNFNGGYYLNGAMAWGSNQANTGTPPNNTEEPQVYGPAVADEVWRVGLMIDIMTDGDLPSDAQLKTLLDSALDDTAVDAFCDTAAWSSYCWAWTFNNTMNAVHGSVNFAAIGSPTAGVAGTFEDDEPTFSPTYELAEAYADPSGELVICEWMTTAETPANQAVYPNDTTATVTLTGTDDLVNHATHGLTNGDGIYFTGTGALPAGVKFLVPYYIRSTAAGTYQIHTTAAGAVANTGQVVWTGDSSATITVHRQKVSTFEKNAGDDTNGDFFASGQSDNSINITIHPIPASLLPVTSEDTLLISLPAGAVKAVSTAESSPAAVDVSVDMSKIGVPSSFFRTSRVQKSQIAINPGSATYYDTAGKFVNWGLQRDQWRRGSDYTEFPVHHLSATTGIPTSMDGETFIYAIMMSGLTLLPTGLWRLAWVDPDGADGTSNMILDGGDIELQTATTNPVYDATTGMWYRDYEQKDENYDDAYVRIRFSSLGAHGISWYGVSLVSNYAALAATYTENDVWRWAPEYVALLQRVGVKCIRTLELFPVNMSRCYKFSMRTPATWLGTRGIPIQQNWTIQNVTVITGNTYLTGVDAARTQHQITFVEHGHDLVRGTPCIPTGTGMVDTTWGKVMDILDKTTIFTAVAATNVITATAHGVQTGDRVRVSSTTTLPAPLAVDTDYYFRRADANTGTLHSTRAGAVADSGVVDITDTGTGIHSLIYQGIAITLLDPGAWTGAGTIDVTGSTGVPIEAICDLCQQIGAKLHFITPFMWTGGDYADLKTLLATYFYNSGTGTWTNPPIIERGNEVWNTGISFAEGTDHANGMKAVLGSATQDAAYGALAFEVHSTLPTEAWDIRSDGTMIDQTMGAVTNGEGVRRWTDNHDAAKYWQITTTDNQPIYRTGGQNGKPYVEFDGTDDWLSGQGMLDDISSFEIWAVVDPQRTTGTGYLLGMGPWEDPSTPNICLICYPSPDGKIGFQQHILPTESAWYRLADATTGFQILRWSFNLTTGLGKVYRNGVLLGQALYQNPGLTRYLGLGGRHDGGDYFMAMKLYEMRRYSQVLSDAQAAALLDDLQAYYGITRTNATYEDGWLYYLGGQRASSSKVTARVSAAVTAGIPASQLYAGCAIYAGFYDIADSQAGGSGQHIVHVISPVAVCSLLKLCLETSVYGSTLKANYDAVVAAGVTFHAYEGKVPCDTWSLTARDDFGRWQHAVMCHPWFQYCVYEWQEVTLANAPNIAYMMVFCLDQNIHEAVKWGPWGAIMRLNWTGGLQPLGNGTINETLIDAWYADKSDANWEALAQGTESVDGYALAKMGGSVGTGTFTGVIHGLIF